MAEQKLVGQNYMVPDLVAKVTGQSQIRRGLSRRGDDLREAPAEPAAARAGDAPRRERGAAMPGVKAILTFDDLPKPADSINDNGQVIFANLDGEVALTNEPVYQGQPILEQY